MEKRITPSTHKKGTKKEKMENQKQPPRILTDVGLSMFVNTAKLRELPLPIVEIDIEKLLWHFNMPVWEKDGTDDWNLTPWEVIQKTKEQQRTKKESKKQIPIIRLSLPNTNQNWLFLTAFIGSQKCI